MWRYICTAMLLAVAGGAYLVAFGCGPAAAQSGARMLSNGDLETDADGDQWPDGWPKAEGASWEEEEDNHFRRLQPPAAGQTITLYRAVPVAGGPSQLRLTYRVRHTGIVRGPESWHTGRIILHFGDAAGRTLSPDPSHPAFVGTSEGWTERGQVLVVPEGAHVLELMPSMFQPEAGSLDLDDITLAEEVVEPFEVGDAPAELRVVGNELQTADGDPVWLQGLNIPSLEWSVRGEHVEESVERAIGDWGCNVIRLPVSDTFWFGRGPGQDGDGTEYRATVASLIGACSARSVYVVLDLHGYRAPSRTAVAFWRDAAVRFRDRPGVLFGLLNEPHGISWDVWRDGGTVEQPAEGNRPASQFDSPGMQSLVDLIRDTGAENVVVVGGLDWGYDLSGIVDGYARRDDRGNGIMYDSHIYPWKAGWERKVLPAAREHPVLIGECGCEPEPMPFIPLEAHKDPYEWAPNLLGFIQQHRLNWTAWCFHPRATPRLIEEWDYTPTPFWGEFIKRALVGEAFEAGKVY